MKKVMVKKVPWLPKSFQERPTGHAIISIIHLADCLNVNPWCIRIKIAVRDGRRRFHAGWWPWSNTVPWCILGLCGLTPTSLSWTNLCPNSWFLTNRQLGSLSTAIIVLRRMNSCITQNETINISNKLMHLSVSAYYLIFFIAIRLHFTAQWSS